jgi:hypothetical protein
MNNYLHLRYLLLRHNILYTKFKTLELEPNERDLDTLIENAENFIL